MVIAFKDMDRAIKFYKEIFGLQVILDQDGNVIMSEGLVLQDVAIWKKFLVAASENNLREQHFRFHLFEFKDVPEEQIKTTGYVIDSIETAVWCLITTNSYKECISEGMVCGD